MSLGWASISCICLNPPLRLTQQDWADCNSSARKMAENIHISHKYRDAQHLGPSARLLQVNLPLLEKISKHRIKQHH